MSKPSKVILDTCRGFNLGETLKSYNSNDVILYSLGIGASQDPLDAKDLKYTYENNETFSPVPSFGAVLAGFEDVFEGLSACPGLPDFNPMMLLHGEQKLTLHKPLETEATLRHSSKIKNVFDKKSGALVVISIDSKDNESGRLICTNEVSVFIRGIGGFGGPKGDSSKSEGTQIPSRNPDIVAKRKTSLSQALLYRLSGDKNPLHVDPSMAAMGGFDRPILHGLCFFGIAAHAIVREAFGNDPSLMESIEGRFVSPVVPGHNLLIYMWKDSGSNITFEVKNENTQKTCIANGYACKRQISSL